MIISIFPDIPYDEVWLNNKDIYLLSRKQKSHPIVTINILKDRVEIIKSKEKEVYFRNSRSEPEGRSSSVSRKDCDVTDILNKIKLKDDLQLLYVFYSSSESTEYKQIFPQIKTSKQMMESLS